MKDNSQYHPKARLYQYKNALHFGYLSKKQQNNSSHQGSTSREYISNIGITIDDEGNLILAEWRENKIEGKYFLFKSRVIGDQRIGNQYEGICQYGTIKEGKLQGENYLYDKNGTIAKGTFSQGVIEEKVYLSHNKSPFLINETDRKGAQCEVVIVSTPKSSTAQGNNSKNLKIDRFQQIYKNQKGQNSCRGQYQVTDIIVPLDFVDQLIHVQEGQNEDRGRPHVKHISIGQQKHFFGFVTSETQQRAQFNGFGVVFKEGWPWKYGSFAQGALNGLGRRYENQLMFEDGFFFNEELLQGFIFDSHNEKIFFGHNKTLQNQHTKQDQFIITQSVPLTQIDFLSQYRKNYHLKSLNYTNNYLNIPSIVIRSPWPYRVLSILEKKNNLKRVIKNFDPESQLSSIQHKQQTTTNRFEKELVERLNEKVYRLTVDNSKNQLKTIKSVIIKNGIEEHLSEEKSLKYQQTLQRNLREYQRIKSDQKLTSKKRKQSVQESNNKVEKTPKRHESYYFQISRSRENEKKTMRKRQVAQIEPLKQTDLSNLIKMYHNFQQQRKSLQRQFSDHPKKCNFGQSPRSPVNTTPVKPTFVYKPQTTALNTKQSITPSLHSLYKKYLKLQL